MAAVSETITLLVKQACDNPVYLRWKNKLGGWNYYLFDYRQSKTISVDSTEEYRENFTALASQTIVNNFYSKQSRPQWQLFTENIETYELQLIQGLADSPRVDRYTGDGSTHTWQAVLLQDFSFVLNTDKNRHNATLTINLPENFTLSN